MSLFDLAFPPSLARYRQVQDFRTGACEEPVRYSFSFPVARWLARRCPGELSIDWDEFDDTSRLDELLTQLLEPAETAAGCRAANGSTWPGLAALALISTGSWRS
jgi:hypothetical protein